LKPDRCGNDRRASDQAHVRSGDEVKDGREPRDLLDSTHGPAETVSGESQHQDAQAERKQQKEHRRSHDEGIRLSTPLHHDQRAHERHNVGQMVGRDVDEHRRLHGRRRDQPSRECLRDEDAAAQAGGGECLVGEQFGEGQFERRPP